MPHISAHLSCFSVSPISSSQCHLSVLPISATYQFHACQCCLSVPVSAAYQCHLTVPVSAAYQCQSVPCISAAFQCPSVMPVNAHQCHLLVPSRQCPSVPITAASLAHISEGEKSLIYNIL
ncbi:unnamed protein product [Staurois parvus]|uniref:Uncharacterized protein n=1 Tax=Staurois parvus TaxID=386267 RepID=A0ABN9ASW9_9NEOB|nr:unnamed protein product [Staurois parvus]